MCYVSLCFFVGCIVYKVFPHIWQGNWAVECFADIARDFIFEAPLFHKGASSMSKCGYVCVYRRLFEGRLAKLVEVSNCLYLTQFLTDFGQILDSKSYDQA